MNRRSALALLLSSAVAPPHFGDSNDIEQRISDMINRERGRYRLSPLESDADLEAIARRHSHDMLRRGFFAHTNPEGLSSGDRIGLYHRRLIGTGGENIWRGSGYYGMQEEFIAWEIVRSWLASPGHRENILRDYTHVGVGVAQAGGEVRATQLFVNARAFTSGAVPQRIEEGDWLRFSVKPYLPKGPRPERFHVAKLGKRVSGPHPVEGARIDVPPGMYELWFFFSTRQARHFTLVPGPKIEVVRRQ